MKPKEARHYKLEHHNPNYLDPLHLYPPDTGCKSMFGWQHAAFAVGKDARFFSGQAFCGAGKSVLQTQLAIYDIVTSGYTQKQLIIVPQEHIHRGFVGEGDLHYMLVEQNGVEYVWNIQPQHNFCQGDNRVVKLKEWLFQTPARLRKGFTGNTIGGLNAVASHSAMIAVWSSLTNEEKKLVIRNLTLRVDEAHHIKNVFLDSEEEEELTPSQRLVLKKEATELGLLCKYILNSSCKTTKLHIATATMYRGDRATILSPQVRSKFVEYSLDWIEHFNSLGIKSFYLQYEEYDENPTDQIVKRIKQEPNEKHYVVIPAKGKRWRVVGDEHLRLLKELRKLKGDRVLDLVTTSTQKINKQRLLTEPKGTVEGSKFDIVVVCMLGREGTDWCPCSRLHNSWCEKSITLAIQTIGRPFRRFPGKDIVKIFHYVRKFKMPKKGITKRDLFEDRTSGLLVCMQLKEMMNPIIIIPDIPEQNSVEGDSKPRQTLANVFGDQYQNLKIDLLKGYEALSVKSEEEVYWLAERLCHEYGVTDNLKGVTDALVVLLLREASPEAVLAGIDVAFLRENGFNRIVEDHGIDQSIYFGSYSSKDWSIVRDLLQSEWELKAAELKRVGVRNIDKNHHLYNFMKYWLAIDRRKQRVAS
jgi:hypothetical protein